MIPRGSSPKVTTKLLGLTGDTLEKQAQRSLKNHRPIRKKSRIAHSLAQVITLGEIRGMRTGMEVGILW